MLSKHTMHSDVSVYIAYSGEFFVRRLKHPHHKEDEQKQSGYRRFFNRRGNSDQSQTHPPEDVSGGPPGDEPPKDPAYYEMVIDNDSGTYRPNAKLLPQLKSFMESRLPGLKVITLDSQGDADRMARMKQEQRDRKAKEGNTIVYQQLSDSDDDTSSLSSSDEEDLEQAVQDHHARTRDNNVMRTFGHQLQAEGAAKVQHIKNLAHRPGSGTNGHKDPVDAPDCP